jgi:hypothetical protein
MSRRSTDSRSIGPRIVGGGTAQELVERCRPLAVRVVTPPPARHVRRLGGAVAAARGQHGWVSLRIIGRRYGIALKPGVRVKAVGPGHSHHELPPPAVRRLPSLEHDRVDEAALVPAPERSPHPPLGLDRKRRRGRGGKRGIETPGGKHAARASCRPDRPPRGAQVCRIKAAHGRPV